MGMTLEELTKQYKAGELLFVEPNWGSDTWRTKVNRASRKGYFKRVGRNYEGRSLPYGDNFVRTTKKYIEGDSYKKSIQYSQ